MPAGTLAGSHRHSSCAGMRILSPPPQPLHLGPSCPHPKQASTPTHRFLPASSSAHKRHTSPHASTTQTPQPMLLKSPTHRFLPASVSAAPKPGRSRSRAKSGTRAS